MKRWRWAFFVCMAVVLVLALLPPRVLIPPTLWDKANHFLAFAVLALLGWRAYPTRTLRLLLGLLAYGCLIEVLQGFTGYRTADWQDVVADGVGLLAGWSLRALLARVRS
jgi:VanZ family protein